MGPLVLPAHLPSSIEAAVRLLREGELVAFPTETVYGLGGRALDPVHLARIFAAKGRPASHPLIAHVASVGLARALAAEGSLGVTGERLAEAFWPGPLTLVVARGARVPGALTGGDPSVAIRVPAHAAALALLGALGEPLAAPSANLFQSLSPTRAEHVVRSLGSRVALVLDGGPCEAGIESTVIDVRGEVPRVLRPGALSLDALREVCPEVHCASPRIAEAGVTRPSPGLDAKHYAPRARLVLVPAANLAAVVARCAASGARVAALDASGATLPVEIKVERLDPSPERYARELFAALHRLDESGVDVIVVAEVPTTDAWMGVRDRLSRAQTVP